MLVIADIANDNWPIVAGTAFKVASVGLLDEQSFLITFTQPAVGANTPSNFTLTGPVSRTFVLSQANDASDLSWRLYLDFPLTKGQWVLSVSNVTSNHLNVESLPVNSQIVFDLQEELNEPESQITEGSVSKFVPKSIRYKPVYSAIIAGLEAGDEIVRQQTRNSFDQQFIFSASGLFLNSKATDVGFSKPNKIGIGDIDFRKLVINTTNSKLTNEALLSLLETIYGTSSVRAYVETQIPEPFELFDGAYLDFLINGNVNLRWVADILDYQNPSKIYAKDIVNKMNLFFIANGDTLFAEETDNKTIRVYSNLKGNSSSLAVTAGSAQWGLQFTNPITQPFAQGNASLHWDVTNPTVGVVRFQLQESGFLFQFNLIHVGDYVTINGSNFPVALLGSWGIINVNYTLTTGSSTLYFDIASDYVV